MRGSVQKDFSVYEFKDEDAEVELKSVKLKRKYSLSGNPKLERSPLTKYDFLRAFQGDKIQQPEISSVLCVDIEVGSGSQKSKQLQAFPMETSATDFTFQEETSALDAILAPSDNEELCQISDDNLVPCDHSSECFRAGKLEDDGASLHIHSECSKQFDDTLELHSDKDEADVISDDDETLRSSSPSSVSNFEGNEGSMEYNTSELCPDYVEMEMSREVCFSPDYLTYGDRIFMRPRLTFFSDRIKLENRCSSGGGSSSSFERTLDDVIHIGSQFCESVEIASVKILFRPVISGDEDCHDTSGIVKLVFAVSDPLWFEKEQKITMLAEKYKSVWNVPNSELAKKVDDFMGQNYMFLLQHYFIDFDEPCEDVVYPKGDPDAVCFSKRDVKLLEPETFINDTVIDFYIKYLKSKMRPEEKHRFHFFNSFFFRKLADLDKNPGSSVEGRAAFLRVRKWTRKVNIFEKDYIFIPVNFNLHWSLIVICHPGEVVHFEDVAIEKASRVPCILHMDSIRGSHRCLKNLVQSYLWEEWKERHGESSEEFALKFSMMRFVSLELPQQENSFDCGLFLLHYVELFLEEAPVDFNPFKITSSSNFLNGNWFPSAEASHKRLMIRKLMFEILNNQSLQVPPEQIEDNAKKEHAVEPLSEQSCPPEKSSCGDLLCSPLEKTGHVQCNSKKLPSSFPLSAVHCIDDKGITGRLECLAQETSIKIESHDNDSLFEQLPSSHQSSASMMLEEDGKDSEHLTCSTQSHGECQQLVEIPTEMCTTSLRDFGGMDVSLSQYPVHRQTGLQDRDLSVPSNGGSHISPKEGADQPGEPPQRNVSAGIHEHQEEAKLRPLSAEVHLSKDESFILPSDDKLDNCVVKDSQDSDCVEVEVVGVSKENGDSLIPVQESVDLSSQDMQPIDSPDLIYDVEKMDIENLETGFDRNPTHKRRKLTPIEEVRESGNCGKDSNS